jgi:hypothetical protein
MSSTELANASVACPGCGAVMQPDGDSDVIVAWYTCPRCGREWSARLRNGRATPATLLDVSSVLWARGN